MSMIGKRSGRPAISPSVVVGSAPSHKATSVLVPPMSKVMALTSPPSPASPPPPPPPFPVGGGGRGGGGEGGGGVGAGGLPRRVERTDGPAGRAAQRRARGLRCGGRCGDDAAVRLHDAQSPIPQPPCKSIEIARDERRNVGVDDGCRCPFVFAIFG